MAAASLTSRHLSFYTLLYRLPLGRSYVLRLFLICFVGTHLPLIVVTTQLVLTDPTPLARHVDVLLPLVMATVAGTVLSLYGVRAALAPLMKSADALRAYNARRILPDLPLDRDGEAGELMATVRIVCERLEIELRRREHQASTDHLTGLANRVGFFDRAIGLMNEARRSNRPMALVLFDIDLFKSVNDTWGHPAGDSVIRGVAQTIAACAGARAPCGRLGGEEFAVLLANTTMAEARAWAETVRGQVARQRFTALTDRQITVSGGIAAVDARHEVDLAQALESADHRLYAAKEAGRNRVL